MTLRGITGNPLSPLSADRVQNVASAADFGLTDREVCELKAAATAVLGTLHQIGARSSTLAFAIRSLSTMELYSMVEEVAAMRIVRREWPS